ncbi:MAG: sigma-70 family RNA polymerase sigma factor [Myxococcaceae bacterium]|nr:sigma-70 family RNA polymerase sigma factor [Myxococcaceae bacterium]
MSQAPATARGASSQDDLAQLLARAGAGDRAAERAVLQRLSPAIRVFAARRLRGADAEDFVQDATLLLIAALRERRVSDPAAIGSFALGICRNLARERARAAERRAELWERFGPRDEDADPGPGLASGFRRVVLEDCFAMLTERARTLIRRAYVDGESNTEIARAMSLTEGNVRVIRHRALQQLRGCLEKPLPWSDA